MGRTKNSLPEIQGQKLAPCFHKIFSQYKMMYGVKRIVVKKKVKSGKPLKGWVSNNLYRRESAGDTKNILIVTLGYRDTSQTIIVYT